MKPGIIMFMGVALVGMAATPYLMQRGGFGGLMSEMEAVYVAPESTADTRQTFYKWQDANGQWHFSDDVPENVQVHAVDVDTAANILEPVSVPKKEPKPPKQAAQVPELSNFPIVTPDRAQEAFDQAEAVRAQMESRNEMLNKL